jgi:hypothetical protein
MKLQYALTDPGRGTDERFRKIGLLNVSHALPKLAAKLHLDSDYLYNPDEHNDC